MDELATFYKGYLENLRKSPHTIKQYSIDTQQFLNFMRNHQFSFDDNLSNIVSAYNDYLEDQYSSAASINRKRSSLLHFLSFLEQRKIVCNIPEDLLKPKKQMGNHSIQTLSNHQVRKVSNYWFEIYQSAQDIEYRWIALRNFCLVNLLLELGLKPSEIIGMKWSSFNGKEITVVQNKKARKFSLSATIFNWLELYRCETEELLSSSKEAGYVWLGLGNKQNAPITVKTVERIFQTMSHNLEFKITATAVRYTLINTEVKKNQEEQLHELYKRYGYSRKSVLVERVKRFNSSE
ncbi:tyrosine-type recombinase/integrase [Ureibacillus aquaedulcis]|uniref:Site-specific integrase n=1 Tax=Ureibacillus aquaedulcis TaxID=3058421 RepID=A0ABT8GN22_9BACL|nr:site-specific integrase [Ureibacillus sp. BA0131]MDN4492644.1 site-specific integrase [Ureibacillus sp. BA0131]